MVEIIVSILLISVGLVGAIRGMASITEAEANSKEKETLQRLAYDKYNELIATEQLVNAQSLSGDFSAQGYPDLQWQGELISNSLTDLYSLRVSITSQSRSSIRRTLEGLVYIASTTNSGGNN